MLENMTCTELRDWIEYSNLEPFAADKAEIYSALALKQQVDMNRDPKSSTPAPTLQDFLIPTKLNSKQKAAEEPSKPKLAPEEIQAEMMLSVFLKAAAGAQAAEQRLGN